jgi:hypothetical protein
MNISESYGGYGGTNNTTKYVPPVSPDFVPQPSFTTPKAKYIPEAVPDFIPQPSFTTPKARYIPEAIPDFIPQPATIPFTKDIRDTLKILTNDRTSPFFNLNNILFRTRTDSLTGITDRTFAMTTSGHYQHVITYTMPASSTALDMRITDGGTF